MLEPDSGGIARRPPKLFAGLRAAPHPRDWEGSLIRILATGDFHIGAGSDYGAHPGDRLADQAKVCDRIVEIAREEGVSAVLFAGDAFERRTPTPAELMVWRSFVEQLEALQIPLHSIVGNHDVARADLPTAMEVVAPASRTPVVYHLGEGMGLATLPWTPPAELIAARGGGDRDDLNEQVAEHLIEAARGLRAMVDGPAILLGHWSVTGASLPNGLDVGLLREPVLDIRALEDLGFDFVVLAHIHKPQLLGSEDTPGPMLYVGSPLPLNFGEERVEHGAWIIDTEHTYESGNPTSYRFIPIESRLFLTVSVDLTSDAWTEPGSLGHVPDESDRVACALAEHFPLTGAIVRIRYKATAEQARRVDHAALRGLVADAGASKLFAIQPEIVRSERARVAGVDEQVEPLAAVELWIENQGIESPGPLRSLTSRYLEEAAA